jgi:outer membrane protein assembly factor BamB
MWLYPYFAHRFTRFFTIGFCIPITLLFMIACGSQPPAIHVTSTPSSEQVVYVGGIAGYDEGQSACKNLTSTLYAVTAQSGKMVWKIPMEGNFVAFGYSPTKQSSLVADANTVYVATSIQTAPDPTQTDCLLLNTTGAITAYSKKNGQRLWQHTFPQRNISLLSTSDGILAISSMPNDKWGTTVALFDLIGLHTSDGSQAWKTYLGQLTGYETASANGTVYMTDTLGDTQSHLQLVSYIIKDGTVRWNHDTSAANIELVATDTAVYETQRYYGDGTPIGGIVAFNSKDGTKQWQISSHDRYHTQVGTDNALYTLIEAFDPLHNNSIRALKVNDGSQLWQVNPMLQDKSISTVLASDKNSLYVLSSPSTEFSFPPGPHHLSALKSTTGEKLWQKELTGVSIPIGDEQAVLHETTLYLGINASESQKGTIEAINTADGSLFWSFQIDEPTVTNPVV